MKKGFTIIEVSILLIIFIIVAFLVAPLSLNDSELVKSISKWRSVQQDFENVSVHIVTTYQKEGGDFYEKIKEILSEEVISDVGDYKIRTLNGLTMDDSYQFSNYKKTAGGATLAYRFKDEPVNGIIGTLLYDVNGVKQPNTWGKDVYGFNIYEDKFEPYCKDRPLKQQRQDCSKGGTGICCSNFYLIGGNFD